MRSKKIGVIGGGFVGSAIVRGFVEYVDKISVYDVNPKLATSTFEDVISSDIVFMCLPTPMENVEGGDADLSIIYEVFDKIFSSDYNRNALFIIKSTVPIGTTAALCVKYSTSNILHSPEFLTARCALVDFITPARNIVGGDGAPASQLKDLYDYRFPGAETMIMTSNESEMVKYMANTFFATKVLFFNEMKLLADKLDLDWSGVMRGVLSDGRIGQSHYNVPGPDGHRGMGGLCFPKDINALIRVFEKNELDPKILKAVWEQNLHVREDRDWASMKSAVSNRKND
jgi:UDPglucose 6-dehydrogenase